MKGPLAQLPIAIDKPNRKSELENASQHSEALRLRLWAGRLLNHFHRSFIFIRRNDDANVTGNFSLKTGSVSTD